MLVDFDLLYDLVAFADENDMRPDSWNIGSYILAELKREMVPSLLIFGRPYSLLGIPIEDFTNDDDYAVT